MEENKKDFNTWNRVKQSTDQKEDVFGVHQREVWWVSFGVNIGVEIDGKHGNFERPALIIRKFNRQMLWVLPTTSQVKDSKFYERFIFERQQYFVALTQLRTISTKRLLRKAGMISSEDFEKILQRVIAFLHTHEDPP